MAGFFGALRGAALAAFAITAAAFAAPTPAEAGHRHGWSGHHRVHAHRVTHRPVYRHRHVAPRRVVSHRYGYRPAHRTRVIRSGYYAPAYYAPVRYAPRRCVLRNKWVHTYYGPQLVKQRVCYRRW